MSAINYHNENASKVYSFSANDEWAFDDMESNIAVSLELLHEAGVQDPDELRSYPSRVLGYLEEYEAFRVQWDDIELTVRIFPVIRSGYYGGGNLDWFFEIEDVLGNDIRNLSHILPANITSDEKDRAKDEIYAWIEEAKSRLISKVEEVYNIYTTALNHIGTFSNGEAIYQLVEDNTEEEE
mgnify:FL=1|jgi:hypothetical protein|tara:strand:- start:44 stop:589 length:546 start_codon:yes stop_codon:yes gene_type:complete